LAARVGRPKGISFLPRHITTGNLHVKKLVQVLSKLLFPRDKSFLDENLVYRLFRPCLLNWPLRLSFKIIFIFDTGIRHSFFAQEFCIFHVASFALTKFVASLKGGIEKQYRPTQSIIYVPSQVNGLQKSINLLFSINVQNPVLRILFCRL